MWRQWDEEEENTATYGSAASAGSAAATAATRAGTRAGARDKRGLRKNAPAVAARHASKAVAVTGGATSAGASGGFEDDLLDDVPLAERRLYASDAVVYAQVHFASPLCARRFGS